MDVKMTVVTKAAIPRPNSIRSKYEEAYRRVSELAWDTALRLDFNSEKEALSFLSSMASSRRNSSRSPVAGLKLRSFLRGRSAYVLRLPDEEPKP